MTFILVQLPRINPTIKSCNLKLYMVGQTATDSDSPSALIMFKPKKTQIRAYQQILITNRVFSQYVANLLLT